MNINDYLEEQNILELLAIRCADLAVAAIALHRALNQKKTDPTYKHAPELEAKRREELREQITELYYCLQDLPDGAGERIAYWTDAKRKRWLKRLEARHDTDGEYL